MSSMMGGQQQAGAAGAQPQAAAVRSGAQGASGVGGGYSTPDYSWMTPDQSAGVNQAVPNSLDEWIKKLGSMQTGHSAAGSKSGASAFQNAPTAQGQHSLSIGSLIAAYLGGG